MPYPTVEAVMKTVYLPQDPCIHTRVPLNAPGPPGKERWPPEDVLARLRLWQWFSEPSKWLNMGASWVVPVDIILDIARSGRLGPQTLAPQ